MAASSTELSSPCLETDQPLSLPLSSIVVQCLPRGTHTCPSAGISWLILFLVCLSSQSLLLSPCLQNYLRVAFQEVNSGCTGKTLLVRPYITTEDVCQLCAEKFKVGEPEEYSLFLFVDETWQQLAEDTYPQRIKAELHSRPQPHVFHFVYRRIKSDPYGVTFHSGEEEPTPS